MPLSRVLTAILGLCAWGASAATPPTGLVLLDAEGKDDRTIAVGKAGCGFQGRHAIVVVDDADGDFRLELLAFDFQSLRTDPEIRLTVEPGSHSRLRFQAWGYGWRPVPSREHAPASRCDVQWKRIPGEGSFQFSALCRNLREEQGSFPSLQSFRLGPLRVECARSAPENSLIASE